MRLARWCFGLLLGAVASCNALVGINEPEPSGDQTPGSDAGSIGVDGKALLDASSGDPSDASDGSTTTSPTSCEDASGPGLTDCGPNGGESCCATRAVSGGTYNRANDPSAPATVSPFRLDRFEVTVGRFRRFVDAVVGGFTPPGQSGIHGHVNQGKGLANVGDGGPAYEQGWDATWRVLNGDEPTWNTNLSCDPAYGYGTWTRMPGAGDARPINCVTWFEAYAFCIWDEGFLPSETEWLYAAESGADQRLLPWSNPPKVLVDDCTFANYGGDTWPSSACVDAGPNKVGSESPKGDGKWGHADLGGNVGEWVLDGYATYVTPCSDCANLVDSQRVFLGGAFNSAISGLFSSNRLGFDSLARSSLLGFRCARTP
jgi:formylglycine-generating enzyme required for sulfatase activity